MRALALLRVVPFLIALATPLALMVRPHPAMTNELRTLAPMPELKPDRLFPALFDAYFRDHFGGRERLIRWHNRLTFSLFGRSPVVGVIVGRSGWLFYSHPQDGIDIRNFSGRWPHTAADLEMWLSRQDAREREYAALGARYLIALAPDKQSVFPEFVPSRYGPHAPGVLDELLARLELHPRLRVLDLRPAIQAHRDASLYHKGDAHWTGRGGFYAAQAIADTLRAELPRVGEIRERDYDVQESPAGRGDLVNMLALDIAVADRQYLYVRRPPVAWPTRLGSGNTSWNQPAPHLPRAVLLGDSFGVAVQHVLPDAFSHLRYYMSTVNPPQPDLVREEHPDVVILLLCERNLARLADQ